MTSTRFLLAGIAALAAGCVEAHAVESVQAREIGTVRNVHTVGKLTLAGQPGEDDLALLAADGVELVVSLRKPSEDVGFDEPAAVSAQGLGFENPAFGDPDELSDEIFDRVRSLLVENEDRGVFLHCGSANRVGAVWLAYRVLDQGVPQERARAEAREVGLRTAAYEERALAYVEAHR